MAELPIGEIRRLFEGLREGNSRRWFLSILITVVFVIAIYFAIAIYLVEGNISKTNIIQQPTDLVEKVINFSTPAHVLLLLLIISVLFLVSILFLWVKDLYLKNRSYLWDSSNELNEWDFQGAVIVEKIRGQEIIKIKSSLLGMILKNRSWRNFVLTFKFLIPKNIFQKKNWRYK